MARVKGGTVTRKRRKKVLKLAKGYYGSKHTLFKSAKEQVMNSYYYAFRDRLLTTVSECIVIRVHYLFFC